MVIHTGQHVLSPATWTPDEPAVSCTCGWRGPVRDGAEEARLDAAIHRYAGPVLPTSALGLSDIIATVGPQAGLSLPGLLAAQLGSTSEAERIWARILLDDRRILPLFDLPQAVACLRATRTTADAAKLNALFERAGKHYGPETIRALWEAAERTLELEQVTEVHREALAAGIDTADEAITEALGALFRLASEAVFDEAYRGVAGGDVREHLEAAARELRAAARANAGAVQPYGLEQVTT